MAREDKEQPSDQAPPPANVNLLGAILPGDSEFLFGSPDAKPDSKWRNVGTAIQNATAATFGAVATVADRVTGHGAPDTVAGNAIRRAGAKLLSVEHSVGEYIGSFNVANATSILRANATSYSRGICARNVRAACEAGGINLNGHPIAAKDYKGFMETRGFRAVGEGNGMNTCGRGAPNYVAQDGDICVETAPGHESGHICMYDAKSGKWISDFVQNDMQGGPSYRLASAHHTIYRHEGTMVIASKTTPDTKATTTAPAQTSHPVIDHVPTA